VVPQEPEGGRGAALAVSARAVHRGLRAALEAFFGTSAGLSAAVVTRLVAAWQAEHETFSRRDLSEVDYVYVWADGVHFRVRLEQARLCCLVIVGVRADGTKELVAVADGERESTDSWAELLRDLRRRGMRAPVVAVGDGALGLWAALGEVFPVTRHQRDWVHKVANVLGCLPKAVQAGARRALAEIRDAPDRDYAGRAIEAFARDYGVKWPKAVAKITQDAEELLAFYDFPAEHWLHLKTSNPIESTFSSVRLRTRVTKGPGSKAAGLAMAFKLLEAAQDRWRAVNGPHLVALVRAGASFDKGVMVERPDDVQEVAA
jgi:putative transposase